jgi:tRNA A-37 threonylcarbamoyl transferase component Bud32
VARTSRALRGKDWAPGLRECLPDPPVGLVPWMEQHTRLLKSDTYSRVGLLQVQGQTCCLKLYIAKSPLQSLGFRLGIGRGIRSFDAATHLLLADLKVPIPRACLLVPEGILLLSEGVEDSRDLRALWQAQPTERIATQFLQRAGETLSALHRAGFAHGDCKWSNLLWNSEVFYLVDLEDVRRVRTTGAEFTSLPAGQVQDVARFTADAEALGASSGQYETFLSSYCVGTAYQQEQLLNRIRPLVGVIRKRHQTKYGHRHQPLL